MTSSNILHVWNILQNRDLRTMIFQWNLAIETNVMNWYARFAISEVYSTNNIVKHKDFGEFFTFTKKSIFKESILHKLE